MASNTPTNEPDWDNMTDDEIDALLEEMEAFENYRWEC